MGKSHMLSAGVGQLSGSRWGILALKNKDWFLIPLLLLSGAITIATHHIVLEGFQNSGDTYVQYLQAQMLAEGHLSVPSPPAADSFRHIHTVNHEGRFYGKYPPGWPVILALGVIVGAPWVINPILSILALLVVYNIAKSHFSMPVAKVSLLLMALSPFLIFNGASYHSHPSCLLFITLFISAFFSWRRNVQDKRNYLLMGLTSGVAFLIRPYSAVLCLLPLGLYVAYKIAKEGDWRSVTRKAVLFGMPLVACLLLFLLYNYALTGDPLLSPFSQYMPSDKPRFPDSEREWLTFWGNAINRLLELNSWVPLSVFFLGVYLFRKSTRQSPEGRILVCFLACQFLGYAFYLFPGGDRYGPRYLYESLGALTIIIAMVLVGFPRAGRILSLGVLLLSILMYLNAANGYRKEIEERDEVFQLVKESGLSNAIVFLKTGSGSWPAQALLRNGIHFDGPVLYALDLGGVNEDVLVKYPGRAAYVYEYDEAIMVGYLSPYEPLPLVPEDH